MNIFTWRDVDNILEENRSIWPESWNRVDVYNDEIVVNYDKSQKCDEENEKALSRMFGKAYSNHGIVIEFSQKRMNIEYEEGDTEDKAMPIKKPLFKDHLFGNDEKKQELPVPIIAFHSYKGGVGRTLSLIALARELAELYGEKKKILVIDSDIEAPGMTWMLNEGTNNAVISYLDILGLMHLDKMNSELTEKIVKLVRKSRFKIETDQIEVEQYFLPVYREKKQTMNIFSTPEKIIASQGNKYVIAEYIAQIGAALGVDLIMVDLRAGITEFSAPFLFDSRVQKFFVSSTSMQSVKGTHTILHEIYMKASIALQNAKVLLTMIPNEMEESSIHRIEDELAEDIEKELEDEDIDLSMVLRENYIIRVPFESPFVHLGGFDEICEILKGKILSEVMRDIARGMFEKENSKTLSFEEVKCTLSNLNELAGNEITAEGNASSNMLSTGSIREIIKDYNDTVPQIVVMGAKGSGKTYIYKQMMAKKTWGKFLDVIDQNTDKRMNDAIIVPLISTVNIRFFLDLVKGCIQYMKAELPEIEIEQDIVSANYNKIAEICDENMSIAKWTEVWRSLIINMLGKRFKTLESIDLYLQERGKKIIFLVDGLEDLFMDSQIQKNDNWKVAIRALCQNIINELRNMQYGNVGIVVFARKDMASEAISINFEQFRNQYFRYELKWTPTEALRLALWIVAQANPVFGQNIDILKSSREVLEERLELLWGKKLGRKDSREALSARWIIAALSDFTGQLQARDIVRFLKYASDNLDEMKFTYSDRYIMPADIRRAIPDCSRGKYDEIKNEMKAIYQILKKFEDMEEQEKQLPLTLDKINLTGEEIGRLESQGYIIASEKKYYLPEIIRFALGFRYVKGARPKVLSLLTN